MKIKYRILVAILIIASMIGCEDSFIELTPHNFLSSASFFKSKAEFEQGIMGVYGTLQDFYNGPGYYMGDLPSDVATKEFNNFDRGLPQAFEEADELRIPTNNLINGGWGSAFTGVSRTNIVLEKLTLQNFLSESDIKQFEGELKFIRAIHYFNLVRLYGDVPLILNPVKSAEEALALYRTPKSEVYNAIIADLTTAIANLPSEYPAAQEGKATKRRCPGVAGKSISFHGTKR
ncbi:MAG: RagB/SusD family nutrient uptake outer membrane protein [Mangrovibacterium sp.]